MLLTLFTLFRFFVSTSRGLGQLFSRHFLPGWRSPAHLALEIGHIWWRCLSVVPPFGILPGKGLGGWWEFPSKCPFNWVQAGSHWPARRSPGRREEQRTSGDGRRGVGKRRALRRSPPFKNKI